MKNGNSIYYDALGRKHGKRMVTLKAAVNLVVENAYAEVDRGGVQYTTNYYPSGIQHSGHGLSADYAFGGKELQTSHAVNLYDFEARYYDPIFGFTTMNPLCEKYYEVSPYSYCAGNSVSRIDPDGREGIVVSGSPGEHDNKKHFLINGLDRAKAVQSRSKKGEGTTWLIYNDKEKGFNQKDSDKYKGESQKAGINIQIVSEVNDILDYINDKTGGDSRNNDQISSFYYVGYSTPGDLDVGYEGSGQNSAPSDLNSSAFKSDTWINVVSGCRTAIDDKLLEIPIEKSIIRQLLDILDENLL